MAKDLGINTSTWTYFLTHPCTETSKITCYYCSHNIEYGVDDMSHYYMIREEYYLKPGFIYKILNRIPFINKINILYRFIHEIRQQKDLKYKINCPNCNKEITITLGWKLTNMQKWYNYNKIKENKEV